MTTTTTTAVLRSPTDAPQVSNSDPQIDIPVPTSAVLRSLPSQPSTFRGVLTPLLGFSLQAVYCVAQKFLTTSHVDSAKSFILSTLFLFDTVNPIAWGKLVTWYFHPGRYPTRQHWTMGGIKRMMFLVTNCGTIALQYSRMLLTPVETFNNSFLNDIMRDSISDGIKYSGFTNHLLLTFLLFRPREAFGRNLQNGSRLYMEDVQFLVCLCAPVMPFLIKGDYRIKFAYITYAILIWLDFILKRLPPQNFVRRKISALATEVKSKTYERDAHPGPPRSSADTGFPMVEKNVSELYFYMLFFVANAVLRAKVYSPMMAFVTAKMS